MLYFSLFFATGLLAFTPSLLGRENWERGWIGLRQCAVTRGLHQRPDFLRTERHIYRFNSKRRKRVQYGIDNGWWAADAARFASPFRPQWVVWRRRLNKISDKVWYHASIRQGIIHQGSTTHLTLTILHHFFIQHLPTTFRQPPAS